MSPGIYDRSDSPEPREVEPFGSPEEWVADRNPGGMRTPGRDNNCGDCCRACELTWRGIDVMAAAFTDPKAHGEQLALMDHWSPGERVTADIDDIKDRLQILGPGASALVAVFWKPGGGHWINAVNDHGVVKAIDGQKGLVAQWPPTYENLRLPVGSIGDVEATFIGSDGKHLTEDDLREMR